VRSLATIEGDGILTWQHRSSQVRHALQQRSQSLPGEGRNRLGSLRCCLPTWQIGARMHLDHARMFGRVVRIAEPHDHVRDFDQ